MPIDLTKITPVEYCVLVAWVKGMSTGEIAQTIGRRFNKTPASIRGIIKNKMTIKRADMTIEQRQAVLNNLRTDRMDQGKMADAMFSAVVVKAAARVGPLSQYRIKKESPTADISNKKVKKLTRKQMKAAAAKKKERDDEERAARELGAAQRGYYSTPLEYLAVSRLLMQKVEMGTLDEHPAETYRFNAGKKMRQIFAGCQLSGLKSQDFEMVGGGGGGMGVAIPAKIMEFQSQVNAIKRTMAVEDFNDLYAVLVKDEFIWLVPSKRGKEVILQAIRRSLDAVAVYFKMMDVKEFVQEWKYQPYTATPIKSRGDARRDAGAARDMISQAQRAMR